MTTESITSKCNVRYWPGYDDDPTARIVRCGLLNGHVGLHREESGMPEWEATTSRDTLPSVQFHVSE